MGWLELYWRCPKCPLCSKCNRKPTKIIYAVVDDGYGGTAGVKKYLCDRHYTTIENTDDFYIYDEEDVT
jgi:hypothetical protein